MDHQQTESRTSIPRCIRYLTISFGIIVLSALSLPTQAKVEGDTITLGAAVSLTGKYSTNGKHTKNGYDLGVKIVNETGGITVNGKQYQVAVRYYDDESTPARGAQLAERLINQDNIKYPRLAERHRQRAGSLSGGERRLLEISRALIMNPDILLVDEPSIGLEPRFIDNVFEILSDLQHNEHKTIIMVEQNAKKGLEFADIGYVLVSGQVSMAGAAGELLEKEEVGRLFLGG